MAQWKIPLFDSDIGTEEIEEVTKVLKSRWLTMGEVTAEFERQFCDYVGCKYALTVSNGTTALHLANVVLGIGPGDEVIVPSLTFVATVNSILYTGATPVFADVTSDENLNISPEDIERKITPKTRAIMIVHYGGYPCDMDSIMNIVRRHHLKLIEDVAHAPGAKIEDKSCGTFGDCACFSFFSNKNLATGEGGMIITDDEGIASKLRLLRSHGMTSLTLDRYKGHAYSYDVVSLGYNYRASEMTAAIGIVQLHKLSSKNKRRKELVNLYNSLLSGSQVLSVPFQNHPGESSYHIYPVLINENIDRNDFMGHLKTQGIQTSIHYPPIHRFSYHRDLCGPSCDLSITERVTSREVTLPLYPSMCEADVHYVVDHINNYLK